MPNINTRFTLSGEKEYKQAISEIGSGMKVLDSEMRKVQSAYAQNADSVEALNAKNDVLERKISTQTEKLDYLRAALQQSAEKYGEADKRTMQWQTSLNNAEADLNSLNNQVDENKQKIADSGKEMGNLGDVVNGLTSKLGIQLPDSMKQSMNAMGSLDASSLALAGGFAAVAAAIVKGHDLHDKGVRGLRRQHHHPLHADRPVDRAAAGIFLRDRADRRLRRHPAGKPDKADQQHAGHDERHGQCEGIL